MSPINNLEETAKLMGVSRHTVSGWIRQGAPIVSKSDRAHGIEWQLSFPDVFQWRLDRAVRDAVARTQTDGGQISKDEADRRKAVANALVAEVEADDVLKSVVSRADADSIVADFVTALRSGLTPAAANFAAATAHMTDPNKIRDFCEAEVNRSMQAAQAILDNEWAGDAAI
jgi:phage terminase Nu1 subunit (DNA packaging protein)